MNSAHIAVVVSENADLNVVNAAVAEGPHLSRRPDPPDPTVVNARLPQADTPVKIMVLVTLVYASPSSSRRKSLWPHLHNLATSISHPWLLMGDFNSTLDTSERKGRASSTRPSHDSRISCLIVVSVIWVSMDLASLGRWMHSCSP
ncbi:hypothetical protein V6N13_008110 [Hibiscus sabdariffa]